ncbi:MAG: hypothetical protein ACRCT1_21430 [Microcoleaceae cyanobacterium]
MLYLIRYLLKEDNFLVGINRSAIVLWLMSLLYQGTIRDRDDNDYDYAQLLLIMMLSCFDIIFYI